MPIPFEFIVRLLLAALLGSVLGIERKHIGKQAGPRTHALVALGAALFTLISQFGFLGDGVDPSRIAAQIVVGIGFIGAGMIFFQQERLQGLTTAAGLWVAAAIGMAVGVGWFLVSIATTIFTLGILWLAELRKKE